MILKKFVDARIDAQMKKENIAQATLNKVIGELADMNPVYFPIMQKRKPLFRAPVIDVDFASILPVIFQSGNFGDYYILYKFGASRWYMNVNDMQTDDGFASAMDWLSERIFKLKINTEKLPIHELYDIYCDPDKAELVWKYEPVVVNKAGASVKKKKK
jgi:hypothetical protein